MHRGGQKVEENQTQWCPFSGSKNRGHLLRTRKADGARGLLSRKRLTENRWKAFAGTIEIRNTERLPECARAVRSLRCRSGCRSREGLRTALAWGSGGRGPRAGAAGGAGGAGGGVAGGPEMLLTKPVRRPAEGEATDLLIIMTDLLMGSFQSC